MDVTNARILLVDDKPMNIKLLEAILAPLGVRTISATNGVEAVKTAREELPDAVLMDIRMPIMDGIEACRQLKEDRELRDIPVVFVTAYSDVVNHASAIEAGGIGFITKPVQDVLVRASVKNAVKLKKMNDENKELLRQRNSLTRMIVHDLSNLLTIITFSSQILLMDDDLSEDSREQAELIQNSAEDITVMTSGMLDVEKIESGTMEISPEEVDLWEIVEKRSSRLTGQFAEKNISLVKDKKTDNTKLVSDPSLLSRIVDNLLFNALKYCRKEGKIGLTILEEKAGLVLSVSNDGEPIPKRFQDKVFEKFAQVEVRESTGRKGVGLGLTFCRLAVETLGGRIYLESPMPGTVEGVVFHVNLPFSSV